MFYPCMCYYECSLFFHNRFVFFEPEIRTVVRLHWTTAQRTQQRRRNQEMGAGASASSLLANPDVRVLVAVAAGVTQEEILLIGNVELEALRLGRWLATTGGGESTKLHGFVIIVGDETILFLKKHAEKGYGILGDIKDPMFDMRHLNITVKDYKRIQSLAKEDGAIVIDASSGRVLGGNYGIGDVRQGIRSGGMRNQAASAIAGPSEDNEAGCFVVKASEDACTFAGGPAIPDAQLDVFNHRLTPVHVAVHEAVAPAVAQPQPQLETLTILVCGEAGDGKSSLVSSWAIARRWLLAVVKPPKPYMPRHLYRQEHAHQRAQGGRRAVGRSLTVGEGCDKGHLRVPRPADQRPAALSTRHARRRRRGRHADQAALAARGYAQTGRRRAQARWRDRHDARWRRPRETRRAGVRVWPCGDATRRFDAVNEEDRNRLRAAVGHRDARRHGFRRRVQVRQHHPRRHQERQSRRGRARVLQQEHRAHVLRAQRRKGLVRAHEEGEPSLLSGAWRVMRWRL